MNDLPRISIIIPSYNQGAYIESTLNSIFLQKYPDFEIIIQDGGSTDNTIDIIKIYAKKHPGNLFWESKKDNGQMDAINKGINKSSGTLIAYINSDDIYLKGAFWAVSKMYSNNNKSRWFVGKGIVIDRFGKENNTLIYKYFIRPYKNIFLYVNKFILLLCVNYIMQPSVFLNRSVFHEKGLFTGTRSFVTEYNMWLKLGRIEMPKIILKNLSGFRMSGENISSIRSKDLLKEDMDIVRKHTNNIIILLIHFIHNCGRLLVLKLINKV